VTDTDWGLVAVGVSEFFSGNSRAAGIWIQNAGEWVRVPENDLAFDECASEARPVASDGSIVAVGADGSV
jgi:hypothetical protein